jgi:hypothetical protein
MFTLEGELTDMVLAVIPERGEGHSSPTLVGQTCAAEGG